MSGFGRDGERRPGQVPARGPIRLVERDRADSAARMPQTEADMTDQTNELDRHIVVGVDGSQGSRTAPAWAMTHARPTGAVVEAWRPGRSR